MSVQSPERLHSPDPIPIREGEEDLAREEDRLTKRVLDSLPYGTAGNVVIDYPDGSRMFYEADSADDGFHRRLQIRLAQKESVSWGIEREWRDRYKEGARFINYNGDPPNSEGIISGMGAVPSVDGLLDRFLTRPLDQSQV